MRVEHDTIPGTAIFDGALAMKGYALNKMCFSFNEAANREAFLLSKSAAIADAGKNWPKLSKDLSGPEADTPVGAGLSFAAAAPASVAAGQTDAKVQTN